MKTFRIILGLFFGFAVAVSAQTAAFPGAEGAGKYTVGGRGGRVIVVSNLNDSGNGSLRAAVAEQGSRIILFEVDGTIQLDSALVIRHDSITIAGQSAPGAGVCLKGYPLKVEANQVVIRFIRVRLGAESGLEADALEARDIDHLILDHCSFSWSVDECLSVYRSRNVTVQWCMITHSLSASVHSKGSHGFGGIWGGENVTFHHNLLAHHSSRNPRFASDGFSPVDFRNNVVFNWGYKAAYGGGRYGKINFVGNYYKPGPATIQSVRNRFVDPAEDETSSLFISENYLEGNSVVSEDNWSGVGPKKVVKMDQPFEISEHYSHENAAVAYEKVLAFAGCSFVRDQYDFYVLEEVRSGILHEGFFYKGKTGIIDDVDEVGGWPELAAGIPPLDSDGDGMPDVWERQFGLDPENASDGAIYQLSNIYTNLEVYLNSIVENIRV